MSPKSKRLPNRAALFASDKGCTGRKENGLFDYKSDITRLGSISLRSSDIVGQLALVNAAIGITG